MYVSVIIPTFNSELTIEYCINSCLIQTGFIKEIIIVDDFSIDDTIKIVKKIQAKKPELINFFLNPNKGGNNARNFGFKQATGQFIQWLDADDELGENKLKSQVQFLLRENKFQIAYCDWKIKTIDGNGNFNIELKEEYQCNDFLKKLFEDKWLPPHAYLLRYESALKIFENNGWNPKSIVLQDREYFTFAALLGLEFGYVKDVHVFYYRYRYIFSVSKSNSNTRSLALLNLMKRIKNSMFYELLMQKNLELYVDSLILISKLQLDLSIQKNIDPRKIIWKLFPGKKLKLKAILKLYLPFY
jgi:glycosyltransferase involved in cell wall biosynthesis